MCSEPGAGVWWESRGALAVPCVLALRGHPRNILKITEATFHTPNSGSVSGKLCGLQVLRSCRWTGLEGVCCAAKGALLSLKTSTCLSPCPQTPAQRSSVGFSLLPLPAPPRADVSLEPFWLLSPCHLSCSVVKYKWD